MTVVGPVSPRPLFIHEETSWHERTTWPPVAAGRNLDGGGNRRVRRAAGAASATSDNTVSVIDTGTGTVVTTLPAASGLTE
jgi:hypothetical protein